MKRGGRPAIHSPHRNVTGTNAHAAHDYRSHAKQVRWRLLWTCVRQHTTLLELCAVLLRFCWHCCSFELPAHCLRLVLPAGLPLRVCCLPLHLSPPPRCLRAARASATSWTTTKATCQVRLVCACCMPAAAAAAYLLLLLLEPHAQHVALSPAPLPACTSACMCISASRTSFKRFVCTMPAAKRAAGAGNWSEPCFADPPTPVPHGATHTGGRELPAGGPASGGQKTTFTTLG